MSTNTYEVEVSLDYDSVTVELDIPEGLDDNEIFRFIMDRIEVDWTKR